MARALELGRDAGGLVNDGDVRHRDEGSGGVEPDRPGAEGSWRRTFLRAPYLRDVLVSMGMITETLETSVTWDRFEALHAGILEDAARALASAGVARAIVSCRFQRGEGGNVPADVDLRFALGRGDTGVYVYALWVHKPDYLAAAFDGGGKTDRAKKFAEYKAQRGPMPEDMVPQIPVIKRLFEDKERRGTRLPLTFLVLDKLNRYAPREGWGR